MEISEYGQYDGIGLAKLVADKEVSAKELAQTALKIAEKLDPDLGAMVDIFEEEVNGLDEASLPDGPFHGGPMMVKDCLLMYEGKQVTLGSDLCQGIVAPYDTTLMKKFRVSGAVAVGMSKAFRVQFEAYPAALR